MGDLSRKEVERRVKHRDPLKELDLTGMQLDDFNFEGASFTKCKIRYFNSIHKDSRN